MQKGDTVSYTVTYLEMATRPAGAFPTRPTNLNTVLLTAEDPPVDFFLYLYRLVGGPHEWTDLTRLPRDEVAATLADPSVVLSTLMLDGAPGGFFLMDWREHPTASLAYFGLAPRAQGRGLGKWLLGEAVRTGWAKEGVTRMVLNTNTLDHPRALPLYQRMGFVPIRRVEEERVVEGDA